MEMMVVECPPEFCRHIAGSYSGGFSSSSGAFSLPRSPSVAAGASSPFRRFLIPSTEECSDELVRSLISDLESTCIDSQRQAAMGLRLLAKHSPENAACALLRLSKLDDLRSNIGRAGAIPPLVALLATGGPRGKKDAATALFALLAAEENRTRAVEAGVVRLLLELMADPESDMVDKAAYVLHRLLSEPEGRRATVHEGGVPVLVEMVEVGSRRQKEVAMLSLLKICEESVAHRKMVIREGAIPPLVSLSQCSSKKTKEKVGNLTTSVAGAQTPIKNIKI